MNDLEKAMLALSALQESDEYKIAREILHRVTEQNQNPGCGGDGKMTVEQWSALKDCQLNLETIGYIVPDQGKDLLLCELPEWANIEPTLQQQADAEQAAAYEAAGCILRVLSAEQDDKRVFVLLSDDTILMSKEFETKHCAEIHTKQVMDLNLSPTFLVEILKYQEAKSV